MHICLKMFETWCQRDSQYQVRIHVGMDETYEIGWKINELSTGVCIVLFYVYIGTDEAYETGHRAELVSLVLRSLCISSKPVRNRSQFSKH